MKSWKDAERLAQREIEDQGFYAIDANILFRENCPNIDMVVFGKKKATYIQVKSSSRPAGKGSVIVDGSAWTNEQLYDYAPIFNKKDGFCAEYIVFVDMVVLEAVRFYIAPPSEVEKEVRQLGVAFAAKPKQDGLPRSIRFRKELPRSILRRWENAWHLLGEPVGEIKNLTTSEST